MSLARPDKSTELTTPDPVDPVQSAGFETQRERIRICHVQLLPLLTGVQRVTLDELTRLDDQQYDRYIICQSPGPLSEAAEAEGIHCLFVGNLVRPISPYRDMRSLVQLARLMRQYRFDIVHTHSSKTGVVGRIAARMARVPVVVHTVHGFSMAAARSSVARSLYRTLERVGARYCDSMICLNNDDRELANDSLRVPNKRLTVIPNGVDLTKFHTITTEERESVRRDVFELTENQLAVGMTARLWPQKNPLAFVKVADRVLSQGIDAKFFLIGDGELADDVLAEIRRRKRQDRIFVLGWREDVGRLLCGLDVFALTSLWEGLPISLLEAFASGLPAVVSRISGNTSVVSHGLDGFHADTNDIDAFAQYVGQLLTDEALRRRMAAAAREKAARDYDLSLRTARVMALYEELLSKATDLHGCDTD